MLDDVLSMIKKWESIKSMSPKHVMVNSVRLASPKTQMNERGSIKDRLAQTDEEAEVLARVDDARSGNASKVSPNDDELDEAAIDKIVDDIINKTILKGM